MKGKERIKKGREKEQREERNKMFIIPAMRRVQRRGERDVVLYPKNTLKKICFQFFKLTI